MFIHITKKKEKTTGRERERSQKVTKGGAQ